MPLGRRDEENEDDFFDQVSAMADRLKLKGKERSAYIDDHMRGAGYRRVQSRDSYIRDEEDDEDDGGRSRFRIGNNRSSGSRRNSRDDDDW